jgi:ATP phosphoribosyltransferase
MVSYNVTRDVLQAALAVSLLSRRAPSRRRLLTRMTGQITPGKRSPTVSRLEEENWVAVQALVSRAPNQAVSSQ